MAITLISGPAQWARVWDSNRMTYKFSSTNVTQPNFQFQFYMRRVNIDATFTDLGIYNVHPSLDGTCEFNPSTIYQSWLTNECNLSNTSLNEIEGCMKFQLFCNEFYGTPPVKIVAGSYYESTPLNVYTGCQQPIPYDYIPLNWDGNYKWVMRTAHPQQGQWLSDMTECRMGNTDYAFLYFMAKFGEGRPTKIRYTIYYMGYSGGIIMDSALTNNREPYYDQATPTFNSYTNLTASGLTNGINDPIPAQHYGMLTAVTYDTASVAYTYANSLMYYFPSGPYQAINQTQILQPYENTWVAYDVDIMDGSVVLNKYPMRYINTCVSNKYGDPWQLFWLNPHGGFDSFTFDKKRDVNYKIKRVTYKIKLAPSSLYTTYDAGERVFSTDVEEQITLRSRLLSQKEAQTITQLVQSPLVYALRTFNYDNAQYPYGVPYIVMTDSFKLESKKNDKEISCEVTLRPSNAAIIQKN